MFSQPEDTDETQGLTAAGNEGGSNDNGPSRNDDGSCNPEPEPVHEHDPEPDLVPTPGGAHSSFEQQWASSRPEGTEELQVDSLQLRESADCENRTFSSGRPQE
eukprot:COSAG02_NODE_29363_length_570_cov_1.864119_1_plen_103_part_10